MSAYSRRRRLLRILLTMLIGAVALVALSVGVSLLTSGSVDHGTILLALGIAGSFLFPLGLLGALIDDVVNQHQRKKP